VAETRDCVQCGALFAPQREHARFCSPKCRIEWGRANAGSAPGDDALDWSVTAMLETTDRLLQAASWDRAHAFIVITEAVWWATMVDATLVRYYPDAYNAVLAEHDPAQRLAIEDIFGGLRFVRNQLGYESGHNDFIEPPPGPEGSTPAAGRIAAWTWRSVPEPEVSCLPQRTREWESTRYRSYQAQLARRSVGDTFRQAAEFLQRAADSSFSQV
jgi:hypothetical protein